MKKKRRLLLYVLIFLGIYIAAYAVLSSFGSYYGLQSGTLRYYFGLSVTDRLIWQPAIIRGRMFTNLDGNKVYQANLAGYFFRPFLIFDQKFVHKTIVMDALEKELMNTEPNMIYRMCTLY